VYKDQNPKKKRWITLNLTLIIFSFLLVQGCVTYSARQFADRASRPQEYERFFQEFDKAVERAEVRDAASFQVEGYPYLRTDRFLVSMKNKLGNDRQREQWVRMMQQLDLEARLREIRNLPSAFLSDFALKVGAAPDRKALEDMVVRFSDEILAHDLLKPGFYQTLQSSVKSHREYSVFMRIVGVYPITVLPVAWVTQGVYNEIREWHRLPRNQHEILGEITVYAPSQAVTFSHHTINSIVNRSKKNPLGIPSPSETDGFALISSFAPNIAQDVAAEYDRIGEVFWLDNLLQVNHNNPVVYYYISHALFKGEPVLQLNYVFWYSARNGANTPRIERGEFDGITVRITLDHQGLPFMVDVMNNCGCYHFFIPRKERVKRVLSTPGTVDPLVPSWLPESFPKRRLNLRVNSGRHIVDNVDVEGIFSPVLKYQLVPYSRLEMVPKSDEFSESFFDSEGIGKFSGRIEPIIFFPMGIPKVGSMRQRGHHPIVLVGRDYFDDPYLFSKHFEFQ
jgi:hypothetical protein